MPLYAGQDDGRAADILRLCFFNDWLEKLEY